MLVRVRRRQDSICFACLLLWGFSRSVAGSSLKTGGSVITMEINETSEDLPSVGNKPVSVDHTDVSKYKNDISILRENYEPSFDGNQEQSSPESLSRTNKASFRQTAEVASHPFGLVQPRPVVAPPLDRTWIQTNLPPSVQTLPSWRVSVEGPVWDPQPENKAGSAPRGQTKQETEVVLDLLEIPPLKMQTRKRFQDPAVQGRPLLESFLSHDSDQLLQKVLSSLQPEMTDLINSAPEEIADTLQIVDSLLQPEELENGQRILDKAPVDSETAADSIRTFFWYRPGPQPSNFRLPPSTKPQAAIKLPSSDDTDGDFIFTTQGSQNSDSTPVNGIFKEKSEKIAEAIPSNKREDADKTSTVILTEGTAQRLNNPEYASHEMKASSQTPKSDPFEWSFTQSANKVQEILSQIRGQIQRRLSHNVLSFWPLTWAAQDESNSAENIESFLQKVLQDGGTSFPERPLQEDKPNPSGVSQQHHRQNHRYARHASRSKDSRDEPIVVYVPRSFSTGNKLLDPPREMQEAHTENTVYSIVPNTNVVKVDDRGQIFLNATADINTVYDFVITATGSKGLTRQQRVILFFQDNNDVVVKYDSAAQTQRKPGAYVMTIKVLTIMPQRRIEIAEPAMRDLFSAQSDGTVRVKANSQHLDKDFYRFHVLVKNPADENTMASLPVVVYFPEEDLHVAMDTQLVSDSQRFLIVSLFLVTAITATAIAGMLFMKRLKLRKRRIERSVAAGPGSSNHLKSSKCKVGRPKAEPQGSDTPNLESGVSTKTKNHPEVSSANENENIYEELDNSDKQKLLLI